MRTYRDFPVYSLELSYCPGVVAVFADSEQLRQLGARSRPLRPPAPRAGAEIRAHELGVRTRARAEHTRQPARSARPNEARASGLKRRSRARSSSVTRSRGMATVAVRDVGRTTTRASASDRRRADAECIISAAHPADRRAVAGLLRPRARAHTPRPCAAGSRRGTSSRRASHPRSRVLAPGCRTW